MRAKQRSIFAKLKSQAKSLKPALKLTDKRHKGNQAEALACVYLQQQGLVLIDKNFSIQAGEVDLIMRDSNSPDTLVFIEVRYRKNADYGGAAGSITTHKQRRIIKAALAYMQKHEPQSSMRFDVVAIEGDNEGKISNNCEINWIANAFSGF